MNKTKNAVARKRKSNGRPNRANGERRSGSIRNNGNAAQPVRRSGPAHARAEAQAQRQRYLDLFEFAPIGYVSFDRVGRIEEINLAATDLLGRSRERLVGAPFAMCVDRSDVKKFWQHLSHCRLAESRVETELHLKRPNGENLRVLLSSTPTYSTREDGANIFQAAIIDLSERKRTEERLAEQARLLDLSNDAIVVRDAQNRIIYWNRGAEEMYGYTAEEALGKVIHKLLRTEYPEPRENIRKKLERDDRWTGELVHSTKDSQKISVTSRWALDRDRHGKPASILETNTDSTRQKKAEAELQRSKELLENLVQKRTKALRYANTELENEITRRTGLEGQILEISDREQERLGQELHDGLCQQMTAIGFLARATALRLKDHRVVQVDDLEKIAQLINSSVMDARNIARDLHKEEIEAAEFLPALEDLVDRKIWRTPCRLDLKTEVTIEDDKVASQLYRILREALVNANKHARASRISLEVRRLKNELVVSVIDNGIGINRKAKAGRGLGFHIMDYRAKSIGARLEIQSPKKGGSRVVCYLPLSVIK